MAWQYRPSTSTFQTLAEIVKQRADAALPDMGLTSWKGSRVLKTDVGTAKNYLNQEEIDTLNRITVMFLDQAEFRAQRRRNIHMADWEHFLDKFRQVEDFKGICGAYFSEWTPLFLWHRYATPPGMQEAPLSQKPGLDTGQCA